MTVHVLLHTWDTPDVEGEEIVGVYACHEGAKKKMIEEADKIRQEFDSDFWQEDMTWEGDNEIHLGFDPMTMQPATIYCWTICTREVE